MESPLTVFLYVLMRDHLPTGTVRWLIQQSQLDGDPHFSAPELEALAERYAAELLAAPPRNGDGPDIPEASGAPSRADAPAGSSPAESASTGTEESGEGSAPTSEPDPEPEPEKTPPRSPGLHARPEETDVELMARIADYIDQATEPVFPAELEAQFAIDRHRRQKIVRMLAERGRIVIRGLGSPRVNYVSKKNAAAIPENGAKDRGETEGRDLRLKQPSAEKPDGSRIVLTPELIEDVKRWALGQHTFKRRALLVAFPELTTGTAARLLPKLVAEGFLVMRGQRGGAFYEVAEQTPVAARPGAEARQEGTLEGKVMAALYGDSQTAAELAGKVGASEEDVMRVISKLVEEAMVMRSGRERAGKPVFETL